MTNQQYKLPDIGRKIAYRSNREGVAERFADPSVASNVSFDLKRIDFYDSLLNQIELEILRHAKQHDASRTASPGYRLKTESPVITVSLFARAWAMSIRSNGSR